MIWFIITILVVYLLYYLIYVRKYDDTGKLKEKYKEEKIPVEVEVLLRRTKLNRKKINYKSFLKLVALTNAIDIAIIVTLVMELPLKTMTIRFIVATILTFPVIIISYYILARYIEKKGAGTDGNK